MNMLELSARTNTFSFHTVPEVCYGSYRQGCAGTFHVHEHTVTRPVDATVPRGILHGPHPLRVYRGSIQMFHKQCHAQV
jgi:hypothetical protein